MSGFRGGVMLEGKVCVVTGAAQGMGRAAAVEMGRRGAGAVAVLDVQQDDGEGPVPAAAVS